MPLLLKKALLVALPLAGLLLTAPPPTLAKHHHCGDNEDRYSYGSPYDEDAYYDRGVPSDRSSYDQGPYSGDPYGYGSRPYPGRSPYPAPYDSGNPSPSASTLDPSALFPMLLGSLLSGY